MAAPPKLGTNAAAQATFRLVYTDQKAVPPIASRQAVIGRVVLLEPFDLPDKVVSHQGAGKGLIISVTADVPPDRTASVFRVVEGLDGTSTTISLEADSTPGCFVHHDCLSGDGVQLVCPANDADRNGAAFRTAASFTFGNGLSGYHPISFTAKGTKRSFLLQPLLSLRDETYTTYFNVGVWSHSGGGGWPPKPFLCFLLFLLLIVQLKINSIKKRGELSVWCVQRNKHWFHKKIQVLANCQTGELVM